MRITKKLLLPLTKPTNFTTVIPAYDFANALALSKSEYPCGAKVGMTNSKAALN
jgi:hypothetical protein